MTVIFSEVDVEVAGYPATLLRFTLGEDGNISPSQLPAIVDQLGSIDGMKGVIISGRGPIWLYGVLMSACHATRWVATFDPRLGAVVISKHHKAAPNVGQILEMPPGQ